VPVPHHETLNQSKTFSPAFLWTDENEPMRESSRSNDQRCRDQIAGQPDEQASVSEPARAACERRGKRHGSSDGPRDAAGERQPGKIRPREKPAPRRRRNRSSYRTIQGAGETISNAQTGTSVGIAAAKT